MPTKVKVSPISDVLVTLSIFELELKDGKQLTSINQGLNYLSTRMSNPNSSKQQCFCPPKPATELYTNGSIDIHDFTQISLILPSNMSISQLVFSFKYSIHFKYVHLDALSSSTLLLLLYDAECLFTL